MSTAETKHKGERTKRDDSKIVEQKYDLADVDDLVVHPKNPRRGDVSFIRELIRANKFYGAIVCQRSSKRVLVGNHRLLAAREEGLKKIPVVWVDVTDEEAERILLSDNRSSDRGTYDEELLRTLLDGFEGDLFGTGYNQNDLDSLEKKLASPEDFPSVEIETSNKCPKCGFEW